MPVAARNFTKRHSHGMDIPKVHCMLPPEVVAVKEEESDETSSRRCHSQKRKRENSCDETSMNAIVKESMQRERQQSYADANNREAEDASSDLIMMAVTKEEAKWLQILRKGSSSVEPSQINSFLQKVLQKTSIRRAAATESNEDHHQHNNDEALQRSISSNSSSFFEDLTASDVEALRRSIEDFSAV